jgi:hypothetical protein
MLRGEFGGVDTVIVDANDAGLTVTKGFPSVKAANKHENERAKAI